MILIVEELASTLRAESKTKDGRVFVDGVFVGVGAWEGAVRTGSHRITVEANGFVTDERRVEVSSDKREVVSLELSAVKASTYWTDHPPFVELGGAFALSPSFGGPVAGCEDCQSSFAMGGVVAVRAGFMFTPMWSLGLDATGINAEQTVEGRKGLIDPIGVAIAPYEGTGDTKDVFTLRGSAIGASIAMHRGDRFPLTLRLGFGGFFGSLRDVREGTYTTHPPTNIPNVSPAPVPTNYPARGAETLPARGVYLNPEVRFGVRIAGKFELAASVSALVMLFPTPPSWVPAQAYIDAGDDGRATFLPEELTAPVIFVFTPGLVAAYRF
jgi:hypothetical protein